MEPTNTPIKFAELDEKRVIKDVALLTCCSLFSVCSLIDLVVEDLLLRYSDFLVNVEAEFETMKNKVIEAYKAGDTAKIIELVEAKSEAYEIYVTDLLERGSDSATRALKKIDREFMSLKWLADKAAVLEAEMTTMLDNSVNTSVTPLLSNNKNLSRLYYNANKDIEVDKENEKLYNDTYIAQSNNQSADNYETLYMNEYNYYEVSQHSNNDYKSQEEDFELTDLDDNFDNKDYRDGSLRALEAAENNLSKLIMTPRLANAVNEIQRISEMYPAQQAIKQSKFNKLIKSPLLKIQKTLRSVSKQIRGQTPVAQKTVSYHRKLKQLGQKRHCDNMIFPDDQKQTGIMSIPEWGLDINLMQAVKQQKTWNPYSIFGYGAQQIHFDDVFTTPDFHSNFASSQDQKENRIVRWYTDKSTCGFIDTSFLNTATLENMVFILSKTKDLSDIVYSDIWEECTSECTHDTTRKQPWLKIES